MTDVNLIQPNRLRDFIERVERLEEEKADLAADIKEVFAEAKGVGYNTKVMRQVIKLRKMERHERQEMEMELDVYLRALGMDAGGDAGTAETAALPRPSRASG